MISNQKPWYHEKQRHKAISFRLIQEVITECDECTQLDTRAITFEWNMLQWIHVQLVIRPSHVVVSLNSKYRCRRSCINEKFWQTDRQTDTCTDEHLLSSLACVHVASSLQSCDHRLRFSPPEQNNPGVLSCSRQRTVDWWAVNTCWQSPVSRSQIYNLNMVNVLTTSKKYWLSMKELPQTYVIAFIAISIYCIRNKSKF